MTKEKDYVKATDSGRLYITTEDFFKQEKVRETIKQLLNSRLIRDIDSGRLKKD